MSRRFSVQLIIILSILLLILTGFSSIMQSIQPIYQEIVIVDQNGNGDFTSIQDAIENANPLSIIKIKPGNYLENNLNIEKKLAIVGESPIDTIIDLDKNANIIINSSYVEMVNLKIINPEENALLINWGSDYCNISNCIINSNQVHGIVLQGSFTLISDCEIKGESSPGQGIKIRGNNNVIQKCNIQGFGEGILVLISSHNNKIINCNSFNNNVGLDIRISSSSNSISNSNIYGNKYGIYIWQNSDHNLVYQNNFWKNDIDAIDESNNTWDDGSVGNYWDDYQGFDIDGDGIGDTPVEISELNIDRYPLMNMIYPNFILPPTNIIQITPNWDDTPSFSWNPSIYNKGIKGYYIRIDKSNESFISAITEWTSPDIISNGVHNLYIRAIGTDDVISSYSTLGFKIDTTFIDTDLDGWSDDEEYIYETDPNDFDNYPIDTDNDHIPDIIDDDDDNDRYSDDMEDSYNTNKINPENYPYDTDLDGTPDEDSPDKKYIGDDDDDDDGLLDVIESKIGSNPINVYDARRIYILGKQFYLVDILQNEVYDILYDLENDATYGLEKYNDKYLLDYNGDGSWDYVYSISDMTINRYEQQINLNQIIMIFSFVILIIISIIIYLYFKNRKKIENKFKNKPIFKSNLKPSIKISNPSDINTKDMIEETRGLLKNIQNELLIYMDKLHQMEEQFSLVSSDDKNEILNIEKNRIQETKNNNIPNKIKPLSEHKEKITEEIKKDIKNPIIYEEKSSYEIDEDELKDIENWLDSLTIRCIDSSSNEDSFENDKEKNYLRRKKK